MAVLITAARDSRERMEGVLRGPPSVWSESWAFVELAVVRDRSDAERDAALVRGSDRE